MPEEFEGDLAGAVFWGADLSRAQFRDVDLTGASISHAWLVDVTVDALVRNLVVNGVDVTAYVNERDPWYPLRSMLRPATAADALTAWATLEAEWATAIGRALALPEAAAHESVNGEFSFVDSLRHLVFAMDKWFTSPVLGRPLHPVGLPNKGSLDFPFPGLELGLTPTLAEALAVRADRSARFGEFLQSVTPADFERSIEVLENGPHSLLDCLFTVFEEEFWHLRYVSRDLALLEAAHPR